MEELERVSKRDKESFKKHNDKINRAFEKLNNSTIYKQKAIPSYRSRVYYLSNRFE